MSLKKNFSTIPAFRSKSFWKSPTRHPNLEVFLSSVEKEVFEDIGTSLRYSNINTEEWKYSYKNIGQRLCCGCLGKK